MANPFYDSGSLYGGSSNLYDSDFVTNFLSPGTAGAEYEKWLTDQGYGGFGRKDLFGRSLQSRASQGFKAASLTNPMLTERDYLNQNLGHGFLDNIWNGLAPSQRGENPSQFAGRTRTIGRA